LATSGWPFCSSLWANYVLQKKKHFVISYRGVHNWSVSNKCRYFMGKGEKLCRVKTKCNSKWATLI
jgi:hypothetical protein